MKENRKMNIKNVMKECIDLPENLLNELNCFVCSDKTETEDDEKIIEDINNFYKNFFGKEIISELKMKAKKNK